MIHGGNYCNGSQAGGVYCFVPTYPESGGYDSKKECQQTRSERATEVIWIVGIFCVIIAYPLQVIALALVANIVLKFYGKTKDKV